MRQLTDDAQVVTDEYSFDGWGKLTSSTGSTANSQLYKGEYLAYRKDPDAGPELQYSTHHRNYNPQTGVFTAADPAKDDLNLYRYVKNNPVNKSDPSGLQGESSIESHRDTLLAERRSLLVERRYWTNRMRLAELRLDRIGYQIDGKGDLKGRGFAPWADLPAQLEKFNLPDTKKNREQWPQLLYREYKNAARHLAQIDDRLRSLGADIESVTEDINDRREFEQLVARENAQRAAIAAAPASEELHFTREELPGGVVVIEVGNEGTVQVFLTDSPDGWIDRGVKFASGQAQYQRRDRPVAVVTYRVSDERGRDDAVAQARAQAKAAGMQELRDKSVTGVLNAPVDAARVASPVVDAVVTVKEGYDASRKRELTWTEMLGMGLTVVGAVFVGKGGKADDLDGGGRKPDGSPETPSGGGGGGAADVPPSSGGAPSTPPSSSAPDPKFDPSQPAVLPSPGEPKSSMPALSDNGAGKPYGTAALRSGRLGPKRALTSAEEARYVRPKPWEGPTNGWPAGFHQSVWEAAKDIDGKVYDPKTGAEIKPTDAWHLGHRPGYEHRKHQQSAADRGLSREEFLNEMWHKEHYRPEVPTSNMSRTGEAPWDVYFGP